mmetsp:Transcript_22577/g.28944  ORF Transcript_22577/g.28944 Transcript_22577/m.28944 type:complete len:130 (+) Transcript_22577:186-575(+)
MSRYWQHVVGGLSGAASVALGAYGAHGMMHKEDNYKTSFDTGVRYLMMHSLLLVATPSIYGAPNNLRAANITGGLLTAGILLFCGSCCVVGITEDRKYAKVAPYGGMAFIGGWLSLALLTKGKSIRYRS